MNTNKSKAQKNKNETCNVSSVPLHAGSTVYVSKNDLIKIYSDKPDVYIKRLADLIFASDIRTTPANVKNSLDALDATRLKSFMSKIEATITHKVSM